VMLAPSSLFKCCVWEVWLCVSCLCERGVDILLLVFIGPWLLVS
jgi:hypothetical protein